MQNSNDLSEKDSSNSKHLDGLSSKQIGEAFSEQVRFRNPASEDGLAVHKLIERCPPLDTNSLYFNLIQCLHFSDTCVLAEDDEGVLGFVSGHIPPSQPDVLFIWQLAVDKRARGMGMASRLINELLAKPALSHIRYIETTITPDNAASQGVFIKLTEKLNTQLERSVLFSREQHFGGSHADEELFRIGPFQFQTSNS